MILGVDIGNSDVTIGFWDGTWSHKLRIPSHPSKPELFYGIQMRDFVNHNSLSITAVKSITVSSVVPDLTPIVKNALQALFSIEPVMMSPGLYKNLPLEILNPYEIGSDLVANAIATYYKYRETCIVVDFGTALTFTTVSGEGKILGVSIVPGLRTAIKSLSQNTAKLFDVELVMPKSALGQNTITAIQSGIIIGYEGLVRNVVDSIRKELRHPHPAIATGGLSFVITSLKDYFKIVDPNITLDGIRIFGEVVNQSRNSIN